MTTEYFDWTDRLFDPADLYAKPEALEGLRVVEVAHIIMGPVTADYLGEFGAEVIKVELPGTGDNMRYVIPDGRPWKNANPAFFNVNHSKYHLGLDLHRPEGQALFRRLVARADVVVENLSPGTLEEWGIGYRALREVNPRLVYVADSGFGQWGPFAARASYDGIAQVASGLAAISGFPGRPPLKIGVWIGDYFGAILAATAVLAALEYRERTGGGQYIDFAQSEGLIRAMDWTWLYRDRTGRDRERVGNRDQAIAPSDIVACRDGFAAVAAGTDEEFRGLAAAMGRPELADDARFKTIGARLLPEAAAELGRLVAAWAAGLTRGELEALAARHGFAAAPVLDAAGIHAEPHFRHRRAVFPLDDALYGPVADTGPAPKLSATPGRHKWTARPVGFHNDYVLTRILGLGQEEIRELEARQVVGRWVDRPGAKPPDGWAGEGAVFGPGALARPRARPADLPGAPGERAARASAGPSAAARALAGREAEAPGADWSEWARAATAPVETAAKPEALDHLRVLDLSRANFGGLFCSSLLAEFGAEVIRLEPPEGDPARRFSPGGLTLDGTGLAYLVEGRNKLGATLALETEEGRALFRRLVGRADVVIESSRPGQLDAWGIGYRQCAAEHPGLIWVAFATWGQFGPRARRPIPDYDVTNQALSGVVFATGERPSTDPPQPWEVPTKVGAWMGWYAAGAWGAFGALAALRHRRRTGRGQLVDVSGAEGLMRLCNYNVVWYSMYRKQLFRVGNVDLGIYPYGIVRTKDGYAFVGAFSDANFRALCTIMGRPELPDDPRFASFLERAKLEHMAPLQAEIERWSTRFTAAEILEQVQAWRGPGIVGAAKASAPGEVLAEDHWWERGALQVVEDPVYGALLIQTSPLHLSETPPRVKWACRPVGADTEFVLGKYLGLGRDAVAGLRARGVV